VGTYGQGLDRLDEATGTFTHFRNIPGDPTSLSNNFVRVMHEDKAGNFWIGTEGGGLNLLDRKAGTFRAFRTSAGITMNYVFAIHEDRDGTIWLGTLGIGLTRFDPRRQTFKSYTTRDGLPSDFVYGILEDEQGNLWLSTNNGLAMFDPKRGTFRNWPGRRPAGTGSTAVPISELQRRDVLRGINGFNAFYPHASRPTPMCCPWSSRSSVQQRRRPGRPVYERKRSASPKDTVFSSSSRPRFHRPARTATLTRWIEEWIETGAEKPSPISPPSRPGATSSASGAEQRRSVERAGASLGSCFAAFLEDLVVPHPGILGLLFPFFAWSHRA
jgi:hypothetical protein